MPLDPQARALLDEQAAIGAPPVTALSPDEARSRFLLGTAALGPKPPIAKVDHLTIPGPGGAIPIRVYDPSPGHSRPGLVFFHGGGWVLGDLDTHDNLCRALAIEAKAVIVAVDYRLAPEDPFPAGVEDAFAATSWAISHADGLGIDPARIGVGGDSAGGNLAAAVALMARDRGSTRPAFQVLVYPAIDPDFETGSYLENAEGYGLTREEMIWFWRQYLATPADADSPYASPLRARDLSDLPPALILTAKYDVLRDEAEAYADRLHAAGVPTTLIRHEGMIHGFLRRFETIDAARLAIGQVAEAIRRG